MKYSDDFLLEQVKEHALADTSSNSFSNVAEVSAGCVISRFGSWVEAKCQAGVLEEAPVCPECGTRYELLGSHWNADCCPELSDYKKSLLIGCLMSDGTVSDVGGMAYYSTNRKYLSWLDEELDYLSYGFRLNDTGEERHKRNIKSGFDVERNASYSDVYRLSIAAHPFVKELRSWYDDKEKRFPDIDMNSTIAKIWYCGDGGLNWNNDRIADAEIRAPNESDRDDFLESLFESAPVSAKVSNGDIRFYRQTEEFLDWIGPAPDGMEYKWEFENRGQYEELMNSVK